MTLSTQGPDDELVSRHDLDDDDDDDASPAGPYHLWWAAHAPETYALTALILAVASLVLIESVNDFLIAYQLGHPGGRTALDIGNGMRAGVAAVAILLGAVSIVSEDEDTTWSAPVARTALVVGALGLLLALAALIAGHTGTSELGTRFIQ